jgi:hypothetical protein
MIAYSLNQSSHYCNNASTVNVSWNGFVFYLRFLNISSTVYNDNCIKSLMKIFINENFVIQLLYVNWILYNYQLIGVFSELLWRKFIKSITSTTFINSINYHLNYSLIFLLLFWARVATCPELCGTVLQMRLSVLRPAQVYCGTHLSFITKLRLEILEKKSFDEVLLTNAGAVNKILVLQCFKA